MVIKNKTRNTTLSENAVFAKSFKQKAFGLILERKGSTMVFQTRFGIHTFFMKYPINVLVLDRENKVAVIKQNLQPNRIFVWNPKYETIIELPQNSLNETKIGDKIYLTVSAGVARAERLSSAQTRRASTDERSPGQDPITIKPKQF